MSAIEFEFPVAGGFPGTISEDAARSARRSLRSQIAKLEREFSETFVTAFSMGGLERHSAPNEQPRLLGLGELEQVRDDLAERLHAARVQVADKADFYEANRVRLEQMLLEPGRYRYRRIPLRDVGEHGCGAYEVRPRLGVIGMLAGWWHVKISSGCPLPGGRDGSRGPNTRLGTVAKLSDVLAASGRA
jgi:hypothetical protein